MKGPQTVPYNLEAEQAVLGCVMIDNSLVYRLADEIKVNDFYDRRHQLIYNAMLNVYMNNMEIDFTTLISELQTKNLLEEAGGVIYISQILNSTYTTANIDDYASIVTDAALKRNLIATANSIAESGYDPNYSSKDYFDFAERVIADLADKRKAEGLIPVSNVLDNVNTLIAKNRKKNTEITGLTYGFKAIDSYTLGLQKQSLVIIAARPAMGKSAFAMNIALNVAEKAVLEDGTKASVAIFSLEMSQEQIVQRMLASQAGVPLGSILRGDLNQRELQLILAATNKMKEMNIYFSDSSASTMADIRARCRRLKGTNGLDLVIVDYLQLIKAESGKNRTEAVGEISQALKRMARELDIPVIALAQLSRDVEKRENKYPQMSDLRESGSIEQDADIVMFLYRDEYYNKATKLPNIAELIIAKNRSGSTTNDTIKFLFKPENQKFSPYDGN